MLHAIIDPSTPPQMSHGTHRNHGPQQPRPGSCVPSPPPTRKWGGEGLLAIYSGAACVAMASDFRDGGDFFLMGTSSPEIPDRT